MARRPLRGPAVPPLRTAGPPRRPERARAHRPAVATQEAAAAVGPGVGPGAEGLVRQVAPQVVGQGGGVGVVNITNGGSIDIGWWLILGRDGAGSNGTVNVDGPGSKLQVGNDSDARIVVSTLKEAEFFSDTYGDILYGVLLEPSKYERAWNLHVKMPSFSVLLDSTESIETFSNFIGTQISKFCIYYKY